MTRLGWFSLIEKLGEGYDIKYTETDSTPKIVRDGVDIAWIDFDEPCIELELSVKWSYLPFANDWVPFEVDLDDSAMPVVDKVFRPQWEAAGFTLDDETMSSCYYPESSPIVAFPEAVTRATLYPQTLEQAAEAIGFIAEEETVAWIHDSTQSS